MCGVSSNYRKKSSYANVLLTMSLKDNKLPGLGIRYFR
jgi:hypothetical protein